MRTARLFIRLHASIFLVAMMSALLLFSFGVIERGQMLAISVGLFAFGELAIAVDRLLAASAGIDAPPKG